MGLVYLLIGCSIVVATAGLVAASLGLKRATDFVLAVYVLAAVEVTAIALALSPSHLLTRRGLLLAAGGTLVALLHQLFSNSWCGNAQK